MTTLGLRLRDVPGTIGWDGLLVFIEHLPLESAYARDSYPQETAFASGLKQAKMLADIIDSITLLRYEQARLLSTGKGNQLEVPEPYPTPWAKAARSADDDPYNTTYGRDPIGSDEFYDWYYGGTEYGQGKRS